MKRIISTVVASVGIPVTVKTRLGWDASSIRIVEVAKLIEDSGAKALTIHCRTRAQGHQGAPDYSWIPLVKEAVTIPIIVNGGIDSPAAAKHAFDVTGCDGVMVARGAIQNPWIFREIKHFLRTGSLLPEPSFDTRIETLIQHLRLSIEHKGERYGVIEFRKHYSGYLRSIPGIAGLRARLMSHTALDQILEELRQFAANFPANIPDATPQTRDEALAA